MIRIGALPKMTRSRVLVAVLLAVALVWGAFLLRSPDTLVYPEVAELSSVSWTKEQYADYFTKLARTKGAVYAFAVLYKAPFPFGIDTHVLGHYVGYVLHDERGTDAITFCTEYYRDDACVHAIVIQEYVREGREALTRLAMACESLPRGTVGYADCFHGIGHGILAYLAYDYQTAVGECKTVGEIAANADPDTDHQVLYVWKQCVDGATMELFQGLHDKEAQAKVVPIYLPETDARMPCDASYVPDAVRGSCYIYARYRMLTIEHAAQGVDVDRDAYARALAHCEEVPNADDRKSCFGGFGMDLVYRMSGNDNRSFEKLSGSAMSTIHELCVLAPNFNDQSPCILTAAETILGRSRDVGATIEFCALSPDPALRDRCYHALILSANLYVPNNVDQIVCAKLPPEYREPCREHNLSL